MDREKVIKGLEYHLEALSVGKTCLECPYCGDNPCEIRLVADALALLKKQEEQKRKWLQTIADTQLAISPTGYESEDELAKRGWEWNGLQMAWEIIAGEERSEHPRLVRCKECTHAEHCEIYAGWDGQHPDWFCADGKRRSASGEKGWDLR